MVCQGLGITAEEVEGMGDVQPALIDAEGLHQVRVLLVDGVVAGGGISADRHGHVLQVWSAPQLHGGVKAVQIAVQDDAVHGPASFLTSIIAHLFVPEKGEGMGRF